MSEARPPELVSVMIGAYNAAPYLGEAIDSVFAQTYEPLELIVVDDGSTDGTGDVALAYGDRITFARQENGGNGAARNTAIGLANGSYFAFLDADDRFTERKLELQMEELRRDPGLDVVFGHVREFVSPELSPELRAGVREPAPVSPWAAPNLMLIRRESFERVGLFSTEHRVGVTVDWFARATEEAEDPGRARGRARAPASHGEQRPPREQPALPVSASPQGLDRSPTRSGMMADDAAQRPPMGSRSQPS